MVNGRQTVIVTGAASGIGRRTAERFAADGWAVVCADLDGDGAAQLARGLEGAGHIARAVKVDVAQEAASITMAASAMEWTGQIDALIANAGIMVEGDALSVSVEDWRRVMEVNATGAFLSARAVLPQMLKQKAGAIVFTASTVGLSGMKGVAAYSASKGAVIALTRQLAADFAADGIRVNAVAPGAVRTPLSEAQFRARARSEEEFEDLLTAVIDRYPLKRWGTTDDIAEAFLYLASNRSGWITGQILRVDGGLLELR